MPNTPTYGFMTPSAADPADVPLYMASLALQIENVIKAHVNANIAHGTTSAIASINGNQTFKNKNISASDNTLDVRFRDLRRYGLKKSGSGAGTIGVGHTGFVSANHTVQFSFAHTGSWSAGAGAHTAQFSFPVTGIYLVVGACRFSRTNVNQGARVYYRLMGGMDAGDASSGVSWVTTTQSYLAGSMGVYNSLNAVDVINVGSASSIFGWVIQNSAASTHAIDRDDDGVGTYFDAYYLGDPT